MPLNIINQSPNELVSNEVQELISCRPHWMIRNGNGIFFLILFLLLTLTWFIKYPEVVKGSLELSAVDPPRLLKAKIEGKLQKLLVINEQEVEIGQALAYIQSAANQEQVLDLRSRINLIESAITNSSLRVVLAKSFPVYNQVGQLQTAYQDFQHAIKETLKVLTLDIPKMVSDQRQKLNAALLNLKSKIEAWVTLYVIVAPEKGKLLFSSVLKADQMLKNGQELFYIQPQHSQYFAQMLVSKTGLSKIKPGQKVLVWVDRYPGSEFGYLRGTVGYISTIPTASDSFLIKVSLPDGLNTNYNKTIFFRNNVCAQGEVIVDNQRLFDRFVGHFKRIIK